MKQADWILPIPIQGGFILRKTSLLTLVLPSMPTRPIHDLLGIWWDWGSHGGQPLQEYETALHSSTRLPIIDAQLRMPN